MPGNLIVILAGNELPRSMSRCYRHRNIRYYSEADLNTERKSSAGAMDSEFQSHLQYVVQKGNITYPPDNWIDRKNINNYLCCKYP